MLPIDIQTDKAKVDFENVVLAISLLKADEVKPSTINTNTK
jgi:HSP20 family molecular chaperone IbpA